MVQWRQGGPAMTRRQPADPAPGPLEGYSARFDDLFDTLAGRRAFRRYLEGLLLPTARNKTLIALANTEPVAGAQRKEAQSLQWFLSESRWDPREANERRLEHMLGEGTTAPSEEGVLVIDEHGDRKWGKMTAHVGRQWLANMGKTESGVVSVSSLWADERVYYPVDFEPYTPSHHFEGGKQDPAFRTKLKIASQPVELAVKRDIPFRAVVADSFYGEDRGFKDSLEELGAGYVLALKPSHAWWHKEGEIGSPFEAAVVAGEAWEGERHPGEWAKVPRRFRDGHEETWWALEVDVGPYRSPTGLPPPNKRGRPRTHATREILNAVFYVLKSGCPWRLLPEDFPPWETVYWYSGGGARTAPSSVCALSGGPFCSPLSLVWLTRLASSATSFQ